MQISKRGERVIKRCHEIGERRANNAKIDEGRKRGFFIG